MKSFALILISLSISIISLSCFWDKDTLAMEREQFPSVIELISGKFLRHSPKYHYWRVEDRTQKLESSPKNLAYYDDLAVSYSKLGNDSMAIVTILKKDSIKPGLYETYANLGTFYIHDGQWQKGIQYIDSAIKVNSEAHFGREIYQRYLAEYVVSRMKDGKIKLPLGLAGSFMRPGNNFYTFLLSKYKSEHPAYTEKGLPESELVKAQKGILGMMKFGNFDSPILLEALANVLFGKGDTESPRRLVSRAYLKASYHANDSLAVKRYRQFAERVLEYQTEGGYNGLKLAFVESKLLAELTQGMTFYEDIRQNEIQWVETGLDVDQMFDSAYYQQYQTRYIKEPRIEPSNQTMGLDNPAYIDSLRLAYRAYAHSQKATQDSFQRRLDYMLWELEKTALMKEKEATGNRLWIFAGAAFFFMLILIIYLVLRK